MVSKELKKLSRRELVDIIYQLKKNEQLLQDEIASLQEALEDRRIHLSTAGSIAEAAISITNVLSSAQAAADLYLQEVTCMKQDAEIECAKMIDEAKQQAAEIIAESEKQRTDLNKLYQYELEKWYKLHQEVQLLENASAC
jgi:hypothetical protein